MPRFQPWFLPESLNILSVKWSYFIWELWMVCAHNMGTTATSYLHPFLAVFKAAFGKLQGSFTSWRAPWKESSSSSASLVIQLSCVSAQLNHKSWTSWWVMALSPAITVFRVQCSSSSCATPKHFNQLKRSLQLWEQSSSHCHIPPKSNCQLELKKLTARAFGAGALRTGFPALPNLPFASFYPCKTQPHKCSKEVKPKRQSREASTDQFVKTAKHSQKGLLSSKYIYF